ncbi:MAG: hypothetical protein WCK76_07395 [Elusimicrobiota bacterium]
MKKIILAVTAALIVPMSVLAGDFDLNSMKLSGLRASQPEAVDAGMPVPQEIAGFNKSPNIPAAALDMTIKLPFKALGERLYGLTDVKIVPLDASAPALYRQGGHIAFSNVSVDYNGIVVEPTVLMKIYFEGNNRLAITVVSVEADMVFGPKSVINKDELMEMLMTKITNGMTGAMDAAFAANKVKLRAADVLRFAYDRKSWTMRAAVTPNFVAPLLPGLISDVNLTAFTFDSTGFALSVKSGSAASIAQLPGYNLAISDGLITNFVAQYTKGSDFNLKPEGRDGGVKFRGDARMEVAGKALVTSLPLKPNVFFKAEMLPTLVRQNVITLRFEKVTVDKAYGIGVPGFVSNWLQGTIISGVMDTLLTNADLAKVVTARKLDDKTVELTLKNSAFLPSFAKGAVIKNLKIGNGLLYLGFEL